MNLKATNLPAPFFKRILFVLLLISFSAPSLFAQPAWVSPYPTVTNVNAANGDLNLSLTNITGTVTIYWAHWRYTANGTPQSVKDWSDGPFDFNMRGGGSLTLDVGDNGIVFTEMFDNLLAGMLSNTMLVTVEYDPGMFLPVKRISFATPPCPSIEILSGL